MKYIHDPALVLNLELWKKDGNVIADSARGHLCTVTGAVWGKQGRTFDTVDDNIALPLAAVSPLNSADGFTISCIVDTTVEGAALAQLIYIAAIAINQPSIQMSVNAARTSVTTAVRETATANQNAYTQTGVSPGYHQFATSFDPSNSKVSLYIDGFLQGSDATNALTFVGTSFNTAGIGSYKAGLSNAWGNLIKSVIIYNRCLTDIKIQKLYLATK